MGDVMPIVDLGTGRTALALSAGNNHACAILDDHSVKCWGLGGGLGYGDTSSRGDGANEMGDNLPTVDLGTGRSALAISVGQQHTCAILDNRTLKCWGANGSGQLGLGATNTRGDDADEMGDDLPVVDLGPGRRARVVSAGRAQTCAVLDDRSLRCWGSNIDGRLGLGDIDARGDGPGEMGAALPAVDVGTGRSVTAVTTGQPSGNGHACGVLDDGSLRCWGAFGQGRLGTGTTENVGDEAGEMGDALATVALDGRIGRLKVAVTLTADKATVVAGGTVTYTVLVRNTGSIALTNVVVDATQNACDRTITRLEPSALSSATCAVQTQAGDVPAITNQAAVSTTQGAVATSATASTQVDPVMIRPDAAIRVGNSALVGVGVLSTAPADQTAAATVKPGHSVLFKVRIENAGNTNRTFAVKGRGSTSRFIVRYVHAGVNVTDAVVAGTFTVGPLAPGARDQIRMVVKPRSGTPVDARVTRTVRIRSGGVQDVVAARVRRR